MLVHPLHVGGIYDVGAVCLDIYYPFLFYNYIYGIDDAII